MSHDAVLELGYLVLEVDDPQRWTEFATTVLGFTSGGPGFLRMDDMAQRFILTKGTSNDIAVAGMTVRSEDDLARVVERLDKAGVAVTHGSRGEALERRTERFVRVTDPFGMQLEIAYGLQQAERFHSNVAKAGFVTGELGLGHILFLVPDMDRAVKFYCDALGMRVSDRGRAPWAPLPSVDVTFLWSTPRHHTLAPTLAPPPITHRLAHFLVEVPTIDDVVRTFERALASGVRITHALGRHTDGVFSFYGETPAGFEFEVGAGGFLVDATWQTKQLSSYSEWGHQPPTSP